MEEYDSDDQLIYNGAEFHVLQVVLLENGPELRPEIKLDGQLFTMFGYQRFRRTREDQPFKRLELIPHFGGRLVVITAGFHENVDTTLDYLDLADATPVLARGTSTPRQLQDWVAYPINVKAFNAVGDGVADDTAEIQAALDLAGATGATVLFPAGIYRTTAPLVVPANVTLLGYGAAIRFDNQAAFDVVLDLTAVSDVTIAGLEINGQKASVATVTEQKHGIRIQSCSRITLRDIYTHHNKGDGVYIGAAAGQPANSDFVLDNVLSDANHRQGLSITNLSGGRFFAFRGTNTSGTAPQAGLDLEPNFDADVVSNLWFYGCEFTGNAGRGVQLLFRATSWQRDNHFVGCKVDNNTLSGIYLANAEDASFTDSSFSSNGLFGIEFSTAGARDLTFTNISAENNQQRGVSMIVGAGSSYQRISFVGGRLNDNGQAAANTYDGIRADASLGSILFLSLIGVELSNRVGATQRYGITTAGTVGFTSTKIIGCSAVGNATGASLFGDDNATRQTFGNTGIPNVGPSEGGLRPGTDGAVAQNGRLFQGSGVPLNTNGANGDFYFRTDTPATVNQRLYVKSAGAWVAIL